MRKRKRLKPFLITGCGRSGTRYISDLLTSLGLHTAWEGVLQPLHRTHRAKDYMWLLHRRRICGDSCWLSVPYLKRLPRDVMVFHTVRHPLKVIRSFLAIRFFGDEFLDLPPVVDGRHLVLPEFHIPGLLSEPTPLRRAMRYWLKWNELCERICEDRGLDYYRYRLEDLVGSPEQVLTEMFSRIHCRKKLNGLPLVVNNQSAIVYGGKELIWSDLPEGILRDSVLAMAQRYGYC